MSEEPYLMRAIRAEISTIILEQDPAEREDCLRVMAEYDGPVNLDTYREHTGRTDNLFTAYLTLREESPRIAALVNNYFELLELKERFVSERNYEDAARLRAIELNVLDLMKVQE